MSKYSVARMILGSLLTWLVLINIEEWGATIDKVYKVYPKAPSIEVHYALIDLALVELCSNILFVAFMIYFLTYLVDILRFIFRKK